VRGRIVWKAGRNINKPYVSTDKYRMNERRMRRGRKGIREEECGRRRV
jgi:hypothetical protein